MQQRLADAGGHLVTNLAKENGVSILPVDSEHSAIFRLYTKAHLKKEAIKKIILTASGGPFFGKTLKELENVTPADALKHLIGIWCHHHRQCNDEQEGLRLSAKWLFDMPNEDIEIVVHRDRWFIPAIVYQDNSMIARLSSA